MITDPSSLALYTDKYFLRSVEVLKKEKLNPFVRAQIFLRKGPGRIYGITDATTIIKTIYRNRIKVLSLREGEQYDSEEIIMVVEGRAQDVIMLETVVLGILSAETTKANDRTTPDVREVTKSAREIVKTVGGRPVVYFGARHWRYDMDETISRAAFAGWVADASTDIGAHTCGKEGVGTIPHALECIYAWKHGTEHAVVESAKAFDRYIDPHVPRIALIDFANKEIDDTLAVARLLGSKLYGIRVDTCMENVMQGSDRVLKMFAGKEYWHGRGVTIAGVYLLRKQLNEAGFPDVKIMLSSGFGNIEKVHAFVVAEKELGIRLFDSLGVGQLFPVRVATMDIIGVGATLENIRPIAKVGRSEKKNPRLRQVL